MSNHISPFAALTGAEKQIRWLEYQSIRLPYVKGNMDNDAQPSVEHEDKSTSRPEAEKTETGAALPQPPPEIPRVMPDMQRSRHSQYNAVIARLKQAELQSRMMETAQHR